MATYQVTDKVKQVEVNSVIYKTGDTIESEKMNNTKPEGATDDWLSEEESLLKSGHIRLLE